MPRKSNEKSSAYTPDQEQLSLAEMNLSNTTPESSDEQEDALEAFDDNAAVTLIQEYISQEKDIKVSTNLPPKIMYKTGDELSHYLFDKNIDTINRGNKTIHTQHKENKLTYDTKFSVLVDTDYLMIGNRRLTPLEKAVMDSVITFYLFGNKVIPIRSIFRKLVCKKNNFNPTPSQVQLIRECLQMLSSARIAIDSTSELQKKANRKGRYIDKYVKRAAFLNYNEHLVVVNGTPSEVIEILDTPIILEFAKWEGQIIRINDEVLDTPVNKTTEAIIIQEYLLQQIIYFQDKDDEENIILYESIFDYLPRPDLSAATAEKAYRRKVYKCTHAILDYWTKIGAIKSYEIINKGREKYHHIQIYVARQTPLLGPSQNSFPSQ